MAGGNDLFDGEEGLESAMGSDDAFDLGDVAMSQALPEMGAAPVQKVAPSAPATSRVQHRSPHASHGGHQRRFGGASSQVPNQTTVVVQTAESEYSTGNRKKLRTRPMPPKFRNKWPDVATMLITNMDGSQILFIRG